MEGEKNIAQLVRGDPDARVPDLKADTIGRRARDLEQDASVFGELHRIS